MATDETRKPLTLTEKIKNVCIGLGALSALILGLMANLKGEPVAQKTWETLRTEINRQALAINKLHARVVYFQAHEEGRHSAELQLKLDALQKQYDAMKAAPPPTPPREIRVTGQVTTVCRPGHLSIEGKCLRVSAAVAAKVEKSRKAVEQAKAKLREETLRADKLKKRLDTVQKSQDGFQKLRSLPKDLDSAAEEEDTK